MHCLLTPVAAFTSFLQQPKHARSSQKRIRMTGGFSSNVNYSAEWINLLSPDTGIIPPSKIEPPRSGAVSFSTDKKILTFGGYAEIESEAAGAMPERFVVNDLWEFVPYRESSSTWGWTKIEQDQNGYIPGPRLATAMTILPSSSHAILLGGWDPQVPGTGGVILDDVSMLNVDTLRWSKPTSAEEGDEILIPGGPTSRHVTVHVTIYNQYTKENVESILLHNHRCDDHVLMLSISPEGTASWKRQPTTGDVPSSRGLHCAAQLNDGKSNTKSVVIFGGAAKAGNMSNEAFLLDLSTWQWKRLVCTGDAPSPRAGACLCPLDENTVLLFGGAERGAESLVGLNDVWSLNISAGEGTGEWKCLVKNREVDSSDLDTQCPPGRNAATLTRIHAQSLLPKSLLKSTTAEDHYYLLQGGWNPFRKTFNDAFVLHVSSE